MADGEIISLREILTSESKPLAQRFRSLFSLKHVASQPYSSSRSFQAIEAIAAGFDSPSALLKHELAYCLGQTRNLDAVPALRRVLEDRDEDAMCRHEAAEAIGALGDTSCVDLMTRLRDSDHEPTVVRETCSIAVDRFRWQMSEAAQQESLKTR